MTYEDDVFFGLALMVILGLAGSYALVKTRARQLESPEMKLFLWSFGVRVAAAIVIYQFGVVDILGDEDSSGWFAGVLLKREWEQRGLGAFDLPWIVSTMFDGTQVGYKYLLGILFHFTGSEGRMPAAVLNCFFGAMTVVMAYRVARSLFSEWVAVRTGWFACFFPSLIVWSAQTVKEPVVILLEIIALYCCIQLKTRTFHFKYIAWCAASILLIVPFRFYAAYIAAAAVVLTLSIPKLSKMKLTWGSVVAIGVLVVPIIMLSGVLARHEAQFEAFNIQRVQGFRRAISSGEGGGSGVASNYNLNNPVEMAQAIAVGGAHLLLAPFPWQLSMRSMRLVGTIPELIVWWWLFFFGFIPGLWYALRHRFNDIQPMLYFLLGMGLLYSLMFGNVGLAYRHRAQLLPLLLVFAAVGLEQRKIRKAAAQRVPMEPQWSVGLPDGQHARSVSNT